MWEEPMNTILSLYDCRLSGGDTQTLPAVIENNLLYSQEARLQNILLMPSRAPRAWTSWWNFHCLIFPIGFDTDAFQNTEIRKLNCTNDTFFCRIHTLITIKWCNVDWKCSERFWNTENHNPHNNNTLRDDNLQTIDILIRLSRSINASHNWSSVLVEGINSQYN